MKLFGLADGNNFYCSCERVFDPRLHGLAMVVLSNNDGCVVARSEEAKALGIQMGVPAFQIQPLIRQHGVRVFSSNYTLYGDMSARMMQVLAECVPGAEVYSIDECFLDFTGMADAEGRARAARAKVLKWTGLPVCVGLAATKTLAKAANKLAKKEPGGVLRITEANREEWLARLPVEKVWGIGRQHAKRLAARGVATALELSETDTGWARATMGVTGERLVLELRGLSCMGIEEIAPKKKNICCAKGFGHPLTEFEDVAQALACYTEIVARKLRTEKQVATAMQVFLMTNPHRPDEPQYHPQITVTLPEATNYTPALSATANRMLRAIWRVGHRYRKVGVMLLELRETVQTELFTGMRNVAAKVRLQTAADSLEGRVRWAAMGFEEEWKLRAEKRTQRFTTQWDELPVARAA
jgi:DNA polymerase V